MTITLNNDEAYEYIDMKDELEELRKQNLELHTRLESTPIVTEERTYPEGVTRSEHTSTRWKDWEISILRIAIPKPYKPSFTSLHYLTIHLPDRTEMAIRTKLNSLGGRVVKGMIQFA